MTDPFAMGWPHSWVARLGHRDRIRTRVEVEAMLAAAGLGVMGWDTIVRFGPLSVLYAFAATDSRTAIARTTAPAATAARQAAPI
jgi:hypothetical protein